MAIAIITGSGTYALPGFERAQKHRLDTPYGPAEVARGSYAGVEALHLSRHGDGHVMLSSGINHRANIWALKEFGATAVIGCTACGAVDPTLALGSLVVFDDLHFLSNRLPDGSLCTFFLEPGDPARGHWVLTGSPFSAGLRAALIAGAQAANRGVRSGGVYGHVDGPRFNTPAEIAQLGGAGVTAVSQTGGPEAVLCGELELPFALIGFVTDYANQVSPEAPTELAVLVELIGASTAAFADTLAQALPPLAEVSPTAAGTVLRFDR